MKITLSSILFVSVISFTSCSDESTAKASIQLPDQFEITGSAQMETSEIDGGPITRRIECTCELIVEIESRKEEADTIVYTGYAGGKFSRKILNMDESGFALEPDVFSEIIIKQYKSENLKMIFPPNVNDITPFYRDVAVLSGTINDGVTITGPWKCSPFNIEYGEGLSDFIGSAQGNWTIKLNK